MTNTPFADSALAYARRGWRVFKIPPGQKIPHDRWLNGCPWEVASSWPREIEHRAIKYPDHNIGIATGRGLAVLDIDPQNGAHETPSWAPSTLCALTPSGGRHLYYQVDGDVRSSAGLLGPGVDVRATGGMVLAPPSRTPNGVYRWVDESAPLARIPASALNPTPRDSKRVPLVGSFGEGQRHEAMIILAGTMRSKGCELPEIVAALRALNETRFDPPLDVQWVDKLARDIVARYEPTDSLLVV